MLLSVAGTIHLNMFIENISTNECVQHQKCQSDVINTHTVANKNYSRWHTKEIKLVGNS
jgi:hypothetical protein